MNDEKLILARNLHAAGKFKEVEILVRQQLQSASKHIEYLNLLAFSLQKLSSPLQLVQF